MARNFGSTFALLMAASVMGATAPVMAQSDSQNKREIAGRIQASSPKSDSGPYQVQVVPLKQGQRYGIGAVSKDFDPKLRVSFADDYDETIAEDDDGGEGTDSYLEFTAQRSGNYRLRVTSLNEASGSYALQVQNLAPLPALLQPKPNSSSAIAVRHFSGELTHSDGLVRGQRVDDYLFRFEAGKPVFVFMDADSSDMDPYVLVFPENGRDSQNSIASDDDSGEGTNAMLSFVPESTGNYIVRAQSVMGTDALGRYILRVGQ